VSGRASGGSLAADELKAFTAALRAGGPDRMRVIAPFAHDGLKLWAALRQALADDPNAAGAVAAASLFLPATELGPFARELMDDPRDEVRAALFRAWSPAEDDVPAPPPHVPDADLDDLLRSGLTDPSAEVRAAAARLAFLAHRGAGLTGELVVNLEAPERELRRWTILALGGATDLVSLDLLTQLAGGEDLAAAAAAVRALGARRAP
jgi:hypothetical protein